MIPILLIAPAIPLQKVADQGTDTVNASVTYTIGANVENLTLTGATAINGTGNASNNTLIGNSGNNRLVGNDGADTLTGSGGKDTFVYNETSESTGSSLDIITDFTSATDKIDVSAIFGGSDPSSLLTTAFTSGGDAEVLYTGGTVSFDVDGNGAAEFAIVLTGAATLAIWRFYFLKQ